jgi:hypothetical protein
LDMGAIMRYAEQNLPVPFDPDWSHKEIVNDTLTNRSYTEIVNEALKDIPWTGNYILTINGIQAFRRFPPVAEIKKPELHIIKDDADRQVAVAWLCETNRRGGKKALEANLEKGWVRNFAIRVKNFKIGERSLYANQDVADPGNLDWFVGEIYITDDSIKPDTKRTQFQPSTRHDAVIKAIRKFYTSVALRARGWSAQVNIEEDCERVKYYVDEIVKILDNSNLNYEQKARQLQQPCKDLEKPFMNLEEAHTEANKIDSWQDAERTVILRNYLRKNEVKQAVDVALGMINTVNKRLQLLIPDSPESDTSTQTIEPSVPKLGPDSPKIAATTKSGRSKARTNRLKGNQVSTNDALSTQAITGVLPGFGPFLDVNESKGQSIDLGTAIEAFRAAVAAVLGEETESYRKIMDKLSEELRRRGINV